MKNKKFRQALISVQQNVSVASMSSLHTNITKLRIEAVTKHYLNMFISRTGLFRNTKEGRGIVTDAIGMAIDRCVDKGLLIKTTTPRYAVNVEHTDNSERILKYTITKE